MPTFDYHAPASIEEALELLDRHGDEAHLMAGGTSFMILLGQGLVQPGHVIGLRGLSGMGGIRRLPDGGLEIGALATHRQIETSPEVRDYCGALATTFGHVATIRIRNQATVGGNLAHADPAQDPPPMLIALGAEAVVASKGGERRIPLDQETFFVDYFESALHEGEILTSIQLPPLKEGTRAAYTKFLPRTADDYATVSVAASVRLATDGKTCEDLRVALGSAGVTPIHARAVENALRGEQLTPERVKEAAALVRDEVDPLDDVRGSANYKREMARVWTERTILGLVNGKA